ncbi:MAG: hypothetical protein NWE92_13555 [Candidatus Bathyarchaeota archaeon]|nr:hypothetical protein [Candidatus Bathyarchaeota archaeon]
MTKQVNLPLRVYEDLAKASDELSLMAKKPVSQAMAVDLLMEIYRAYLSNPCTLDMFSQQLQNAQLMDPKEFDAYWDEPAQTKVPKPKAKTKKA